MTPSETMNLSYYEDYWDSQELKEQFVRFLIDLFGLDLSGWDRAGYWDRDYRPFSYVAGNSLVANVCVYSLAMTVDGKPLRAAQISAVGTRPEYRGRGLGRQLMQAALNWARPTHDFFYLFANAEAHAFYSACGFRPVEEYKTRLSISGAPARGGTIRLDMDQPGQREQVYRMACRRTPVSDVLGVSTPRLLMFWCLYALRDHVYYIPELDVLVLFRRKPGRLTIFDIVGAAMPSFADLYPFIGDSRDDAIEFLFMVDKLNVEDGELIRVEGNGAHLSGSFPLKESCFVFPITSQA